MPRTGEFTLMENFEYAVSASGFIDFLYEFQTKRVNDKGKSPIDDALLELLDETIYYAQPATSRNDILRKFKESVAKTSLDEDAMLILNLHVDKVIKKYSKEG